ncbi:unnamed protein product [Ectocarpus sp. 13 AM-2016]
MQGLELPSRAAGMEQGNGRWDPSRYTSRPEEWIRPPPSVIKQRWDDSAKAFVPVNNYTFDGLYRRHHPLDHRCDEDYRRVDNERYMVTRGDGDDSGCSESERDGDIAQEESPSRPYGPSRSSPTAADPLPGAAGGSFAKRVESIMQEEYGTFFDGMTQSATELYQHMINDSGSWGRVDDPIGVFLRRAAFFIVQHPSPATRAELAVARERDLVAKGFGGKKNDLARPIALAGKFKPRGLERDLARAALLASEHVPMGREALREFVRQLDAIRAGPPSIFCNQTPKTASTGHSYGSAPVDTCRSLLERRLEAAAALADPFKVRLEADGVLNVRVLARVPVRAWGLPPHFIEEIERMLGLLTARTCASEHLRAHRGKQKGRPPGLDAPRTPVSCSGDAVANAKPNGRDGSFRCRDRNKGRTPKRQHLFEFDPRYQRSSLDPFGRPPRLDRVQACLNPRQDTEADGQPSPKDEDDIPQGIWDRPAASENPSVKDGTGDTRRIDVVPEAATAAPGCSLPSPLVECTLLDTAQSDLLAEQESSSQRKLNAQREQPPPNQRTPTKKSGRSEGTVSSSAPAKTSPSSSRRFTCRARPDCGATFAKASTLKIHERSHAEVPEYHRLRRSPQLFRDRRPASFEGAGAATEKFRLRTTLPYSVRQELRQLHEEKVLRTRQSLLAGPGLSGKVAT